MFNKLFGGDEPSSSEAIKHIALENTDSKADLADVLIAADKIESMSDDDLTEAKGLN